jgi:hypothetical protein
MGKTQWAKSRFHSCPQKNDVTCQPKEGRRCPKSTVGKVAEGTKEGLTPRDTLSLFACFSF